MTWLCQIIYISLPRRDNFSTFCIVARLPCGDNISLSPRYVCTDIYQYFQSSLSSPGWLSHNYVQIIQCPINPVMLCVILIQNKAFLRWGGNISTEVTKLITQNMFRVIRCEKLFDALCETANSAFEIRYTQLIIKYNGHGCHSLLTRSKQHKCYHAAPFKCF